ncbi:hypothetical protein F2Q68_00045648, partial [Brassica cretica]
MDYVLEVWNLATEPAFMCYGSLIIGAAVFLIIRFCPQYGQANVMVYSGICSLVGSLSALDTFNTTIVSLLYYVMLTSLTILASVIMTGIGKMVLKLSQERVVFVTILSESTYGYFISFTAMRNDNMHNE